MENHDRVRGNTSDKTNTKLDRQMVDRVRFFALKRKEEITRQIEALDREWDMERILETNASALLLVGLTLGVSQNKRWLIMPGIIASFLLQHAVQGWCPPVPIFRRLGVRTRKEIELEKTALKFLRGDFEQTTTILNAETALEAARA
jgi:hypothetical protein